ASSVFIVRESGDAFSEDTKSRVKTFVEEEFGYGLDFTIDEIRPGYGFDVSCQGSCPQAIRAYLEGKDFEDAVRLAVSIGGDSDTIACMAGAIAGAAGQIPEDISSKAYDILSPDLQMILDKFEHSI
ncbi:MAG: ADP-ribosylglycohydrolase family protein, partial [Candidatus Cryptobacteroides sp.]|nr:ADP-ribosylglycohydrolase family protein [Candidatus Cryptobacteroides sp.]